MGQTYLCETDGTCPRHGKYIYFCHQCHVEWQEANPLTTKAIAAYAGGKGSKSSIDAAKKKDREARSVLSPPVKNPGDNSSGLASGDALSYDATADRPTSSPEE